MNITGIEVIPFETFIDDRFSNGNPYPKQNGNPHPKQKVLQTLTKITTDEGAEGHYVGGGDTVGGGTPGSGPMLSGARQ